MHSKNGDLGWPVPFRAQRSQGGCPVLYKSKIVSWSHIHIDILYSSKQYYINLYAAASKENYQHLRGKMNAPNLARSAKATYPILSYLPSLFHMFGWIAAAIVVDTVASLAQVGRLHHIWHIERPKDKPAMADRSSTNHKWHSEPLPC